MAVEFGKLYGKKAPRPRPRVTFSNVFTLTSQSRKRGTEDEHGHVVSW